MSTGSVVIAFLLSDINNLSFLYFFVSFASFISFSLLRESAFVSLIFLYFPIFNVIISVLKFLISFCMFSIYSEVFIFVLFSFLKWKLRLLIWKLSSFLLKSFNAVDSPLNSAASITSHKLWCYIFISVQFKTCSNLVIVFWPKDI